MSVTEILDTLANLGNEHLKAIKTLPLSDITALTNMQMKAYNNISPSFNLPPQHLKGKNWFNSEEHIQVLEKLFSKYKLTPENALSILEKQHPEKLKHLSENPEQLDKLVTDFMQSNSWSASFYSAVTYVPNVIYNAMPSMPTSFKK